MVYRLGVWKHVCPLTLQNHHAHIWKLMHDRQDFFEELYINVTLTDYAEMGPASPNLSSTG